LQKNRFSFFVHQINAIFKICRKICREFDNNVFLITHIVPVSTWGGSDVLRHHLQRRGWFIFSAPGRPVVHQVRRVRLLLGPVVATGHRLERGGVVRAGVGLCVGVVGGAVTAWENKSNDKLGSKLDIRKISSKKIKKSKPKPLQTNANSFLPEKLRSKVVKFRTESVLFH